MQNPFERYDLDPREGVSAITERLRELAEETSDPAEREALRAAWEELTMHPQRRLRAALFAHPETRPPLGSPPTTPRVRVEVKPPPTVFELAARPSVRAALRREPSPPAPADPLDDI